MPDAGAPHRLARVARAVGAGGVPGLCSLRCVYISFLGDGYSAGLVRKTSIDRGALAMPVMVIPGNSQVTKD